MDTPIVLINGAKCETPCFPRSGRKAIRSSNNPNIAVTTIAAINAHQMEPQIYLVTKTPIKAPNIKISPCAILIIPKTPKTSVNPRATIA